MGFTSRGGKTKGAATGTTVVAAGTRVDGELKPAGDLALDGILIGAIDSPHDVAIGPEGSFEGSLRAQTVRIAGHANGCLDCERVEILPTGFVSGEIHTDALIISPGGRFRGESRDRTDPIRDGLIEEKDAVFLRPVAP